MLREIKDYVEDRTVRNIANITESNVYALDAMGYQYVDIIEIDTNVEIVAVTDSVSIIK